MRSTQRDLIPRRDFANFGAGRRWIIHCLGQVHRKLSDPRSKAPARKTEARGGE
jgi:hypothetical protein